MECYTAIIRDPRYSLHVSGIRRLLVHKASPLGCIPDARACLVDVIARPQDWEVSRVTNSRSIYFLFVAINILRKTFCK
ncbi:MAG: hypothetical protein ACFFD2_05410 [Promethearchaeota archaeon]